MPPFSDDESEEEDFDLRDVSSDVELDPSALEVPSDEEAELAMCVHCLILGCTGRSFLR